MKNKRGWLRVAEAFIGIVIITSVLIVVISQHPRGDSEEEIYKMERIILRQISLNDTMRQEVLDYNLTYLDNLLDDIVKGEIEIKNNEIIEDLSTFIRSINPPYWEYEIKICKIDNSVICALEDYKDTEVYADEILISADLETYSPRKLKLFMWRE